jgi:hypothetical protein
MKVLSALIAVCAIVSTIGITDASAQSWGRRGADARCKHGGSVEGRWYCNLKNAPAGPWNNNKSNRPQGNCGGQPCR